MKKTLSLLVAMFLAFVLSVPNVYASDLANQITLNSLGLGDSVKFEKYYDDVDDINYVHVTLAVNQSSIDTILNQKPGVNGDLSMFYFQLNPKIEGQNIKTANEQVWTGEGLIYEDFYDAKDALDAKLDQGNLDTEQEVYPTVLTVQYSIDDGKTWKASSGAGNGLISIKDNLIQKLGTEELEYGKNFRFAMYDSYTFLCGWQVFDATNQPLQREYVAVEWQMNFPITGQVGDQDVYFISLEDALASGSKYIDINEDVLVESDVVIPEDVFINIADGATLEIKEGNTFENNGKIYGDVRVDGVTKTYSSIIIMPIENGDVSVERISAANGELVTITSKAKEGYKLKKLVVIDLFNDEEIEVVDGKFKMPSGPVEISAEFEVDNPSTLDNVMVYVAIAGISALFIAGNILYLKKNN